MNLGAGQPAIPPEDVFFLALNCALRNAFASLHSEMQNVIHDAFEQFRLSTPPPAMSQRRLEHSSTPISDPETEIVHSHLWKARCKQVALKLMAVTGGVRKRRRSRPETIGSLATCKHPKRKVTFQRLVAEVAQDVKADWRFQSSVVPSVLDITVSTQSNFNSASDSRVSDISTIPNRSFVNEGCDGVSSVFVAKVGEIDENLGHRKEQSFNKSVKVNGKQNDNVVASILVGIGIKHHMQCPDLCGNGREHHALQPFDEMPKSRGLCSVGEIVTSIRDKGGGLAHRPVEHGSGVNYEEEAEYFDKSIEKDDQADHGSVVSKKELVETKNEVKKKGVLKEDVLVDRIENARVSDCVVISASCLKTDKYGCTANTEKAPALRGTSMVGYMFSKTTMEMSADCVLNHVNVSSVKEVSMLGEIVEATYISVQTFFQLPEKNIVADRLNYKPSLVSEDLGSEEKMVHPIQGITHQWDWCKQELRENAISLVSPNFHRAGAILNGNKNLILHVANKSGNSFQLTFSLAISLIEWWKYGLEKNMIRFTKISVTSFGKECFKYDHDQGLISSGIKLETLSLLSAIVTFDDIWGRWKSKIIASNECCSEELNFNYENVLLLLLSDISVSAMEETYTSWELLQREYQTYLVDGIAIAIFHLPLNEAAEVYKNLKLKTGSAYEFDNMWKRGIDSRFFNFADQMCLIYSPHKQHTMKFLVGYVALAYCAFVKSDQSCLQAENVILVVASYVYRRMYKDGRMVHVDGFLKSDSKFADLLEFDEYKMQELMRPCVTIHSDHEDMYVSTPNSPKSHGDYSELVWSFNVAKSEVRGNAVLFCYFQNKVHMGVSNAVEAEISDVGNGFPLVLATDILDNKRDGVFLINNQDVRTAVLVHDDGLMIMEADIADGDKEHSISFFWKMCVYLQLPLLVKQPILAARVTGSLAYHIDHQMEDKKIVHALLYEEGFNVEFFVKPKDVVLVESLQTCDDFVAILKGLEDESIDIELVGVIRKSWSLKPKHVSVTWQWSQGVKEDSETECVENVTYHSMHCSEDEIKDGKLVISTECLKYGWVILHGIQSVNKSSKKSLKDVVTENKFEKKLLADNVPPSNIEVIFADVVPPSNSELWKWIGEGLEESHFPLNDVMLLYFDGIITKFINELSSNQLDRSVKPPMLCLGDLALIMNLYCKWIGLSSVIYAETCIVFAQIVGPQNWYKSDADFFMRGLNGDLADLQRSASFDSKCET